LVPITLRPSLLFSTATSPSALPTLSLHDALPISRRRIYPTIPDERLRSFVIEGLRRVDGGWRIQPNIATPTTRRSPSITKDRSRDRKSTRLNSSHDQISYAVFCLKKKKKKQHK